MDKHGPERRLKIFIYARILVSFLFLASTVVLNFQDPSTTEGQLQVGLIRLMAFSFLFSAVSHFVIKYEKSHSFLTYLQTIWDLLFVTVLLLLTGGALSPYSFLYLLSIMNAGVLLGRREAVYTASLCGILYGAMVDFQYFGLLQAIGLNQSDAVQIGAVRLFYNIFLNLIGYFLAALITGYLYERARTSEDALLTKTVDYEELQKLNTTIVTNLESGLVTITPTGRIRVFNRYAEDLTGKTQAESYDLPIGNIFPAISNAFEGPVSNREFEYLSPTKGKMTLGYNSVPFTDRDGNFAGVIINFKDLTSIKKMEAALKKADRLAVIGELSARMAHEIRNPLAAISGSVQLMAEQAPNAGAEGRLLSIVVREADRLNMLISEFLAYARPSQPKKEKINLRVFVEETCSLLSSDDRYQSVSTVNLVQEHITVNADANQLRQVLINLMNNAAEALKVGCRIEIAAEYQLRSNDEFINAPVAVIVVTDNGPGIEPGTEAHLFEPFWTTKPEGTGLGLAIVYRIVEAHGGIVSVESPSTGGSRFIIKLPV